MKIFIISVLALSIVILFSGMKKPNADPMSSWVKLSGSDGKDICINENGEFFLLNTVGKLYQYVAPKWKELTTFKNTKFYAENKGIKIFFANGCFNTVECRTDNGGLGKTGSSNCYWKHESDVAIDSDGTIYYMESNNSILSSKCRKIIKIPGSYSRIAAGGGQVWMIDNKGMIYKLKDLKHVNMGWEQKPGGPARDIAVSNDGNVFVVNTQGRIFKWTGFRWDQLDGSDGLRIAANNKKLVLINTQREIYTRGY